MSDTYFYGSMIFYGSVIAFVFLYVATAERRMRRYDARSGGKLRIYLCSPFRGSDELMNVDFARRVCRELSLAGAVVFCPHIYFTQFLNDAVEAERNAGITNGQEIMKGFHEVWFVLPPWRNVLSTGMIWDNEAAQTAQRRRVFALTERDLKKAIEKVRGDLR